MSRTVIKPQPGFRAELPGLDLATLIQMTCARRERLVVRVSSYGEEGYLFSSDGRIVHASVGELEGDEAVLRMLGWPTGDFAICTRPFPTRPTVETSTEGLLLRAAQRSDEAALDRETDRVLGEEVGLAEQLEGPEPASRPYAPLPALNLPQRPEPKHTPPPPPRSWPLDATPAIATPAIATPAIATPATTTPAIATPTTTTPALATLLQTRSDDELPTMPTPAPKRPAIVPEPRRAPPQHELPPVSLGRISEPPRRPSDPPVNLPRPVARRLPPPPPASARKDPALLASVRIDARGTLRSTSGDDEQLAQLVAYVSRIVSLVQADFALDNFHALHAELSGKRVLIYQESGELVGVVMKPGSSAQELRQKLGV